MSPRRQDSLFRTISAAMQRAADNARIDREAAARQEREAEADTVCPGGAACVNPKCQAARAILLMGGTWQEVFDNEDRLKKA